MAAGVVVADMPRLGRPSAGRHSLPCVHPLEARGELTCDPSVVDDQRPVRADGGSLRELGDAREKPGREPRPGDPLAFRLGNGTLDCGLGDFRGKSLRLGDGDAQEDPRSQCEVQVVSREARGSLNASTSVFATPATHFTYAPWVTAVAQLH